MSELISVITPPETGPNLGELGEQLAARYLQANGYRIVLTNFKVPIGRNSKGVARTGEIDIIALDGETLCFVEVKTRRSEAFVKAIANVDLRKRIQITRTARMYRSIFNIRDTPIRFDVVTVLMPDHTPAHVELQKDFWNEAGLRSRRQRAVRDNIPY